MNTIALVTALSLSITLVGSGSPEQIKPQSKPETIERISFTERLTPLANLISKGEGEYNSVNRGWAGDTPGGIKKLTGKEFHQYTISEIVSLQKKSIHAVGRYQFIPSTFNYLVKISGIDHNTKFTPKTQDRLFATLILNKRPIVVGYIMGNHSNLQLTLDELSKEWASIEYRNGRSYYSNGGNRSHISRAELIPVIESIRV